MIVSHERRFIFLKTRKTAGTSIEIALSRHCGPRDIITPISPADESARAGPGMRGAQHWVKPFHELGWSDWLRLASRGHREHLYNHVHARAVRRRVGRQVWRAYFKFCVERNPWDRAVSLYFWRTRKMDPRPPLAGFLRGLDPGLLTNWPIYTLKGSLAVDRVLRYETLADDLAAAAAHLGLPALELPRAKGDHRADRRSYRELMGAAERDLIADVCRREIEAFGYSF
jgi:hypothetical protein